MPDAIADLNAALEGRYRIEREVGQGGMAIVYLAIDEKHQRQVALKVLRSQLAATLGPDRFLREIEIAAQLQHPHILPLYDSGQAGDYLYYVMPFVQGESLRAKLSREHELPVAEALKILREVIDALAYAHDQGVVHRDVKPDNVMLSGGHAIVTDFGVAKAVSEATGRHELTTAGIALGTPSYMSPEQAAAEPNVDHRTDVYAVGVMAYEMLAGRVPFVGGSSQAILAAHVTESPSPVSKHRPAVPKPLEKFVMRCLEKRPADRWQSTGELLPQLEGMATPSGGLDATSRAPAYPSSRRPVAAVVAGAAVVAAAVALVAWSSRGGGTLEPGQITRLTNDPGLEVDPVMSPDGNTVAYAAGPPGQMRIFLRQIGSARAIPLVEALAENHRWPQWSPDGRFVLFQAGGQYRGSVGNFEALGGTVQVIPTLGGNPRHAITPDPAVSMHSAAWSPDAQEVAFVRDQSLYRSAADGGGSPQHLADVFQPHSLSWSPDGRWIAYVSGNPMFVFGTDNMANFAPSSLWLISAGGGDPIRITPDAGMDLSPSWMPDSRDLLFVSSRAGGRDIYRVGISASGEPNGEPVRMTTGLEAHTISVAPDGRSLTYSAYTAYSNIWAVDASTTGPVSVDQARQLTFGNESIEGITLSPDGRTVAYDSDRSGNFDVWRVDLQDGNTQQVTTDPAEDFVQQWSRDGDEIAFHSFRTGSRDVYVISVPGGQETQVTSTPNEDANPTWSADGNSIAFQSDAAEVQEIFVTSRTTRGEAWSEPRRLTTGGGIDPSWSKDGRSVAYIWEGSLRVVDADGSNPRALVQTDDAAEVPSPEYIVWSADSRTVYYKAYDVERRSSIWSIPASGGTPTLHVAFDNPARPSLRREFATDGERFYFTIARHESDVWVMELESN